jgi:hypothetical protein
MRGFNATVDLNHLTVIFTLQQDETIPLPAVTSLVAMSAALG